MAGPFVKNVFKFTPIPIYTNHLKRIILNLLFAEQSIKVCLQIDLLLNKVHLKKGIQLNYRYKW